MRKWAPLGVFLALAAATSVALLPLCGVLHRCGCRAPWSGGETLCNVHNLEGPHCPWCEHKVLGGLANGGNPGRAGPRFPAGSATGGVIEPDGAWLAVGALPLALLVSGGAAWLLTDYPHFVVDGARARLGIPAGPLRCVVSGPGKGPSCCAEGRPAGARPSPAP